MAITDTLLETARADTQLLELNRREGDFFSRPRDVKFLLIAPDKDKAELVASFIDDNRYGSAHVEPYEQRCAIFVVIHTPIEQNIICSISGLMACVGVIFDVEYDGWECEIQR